MKKNQQFPIHEAMPLVRHDEGVCCGEGTLHRGELEEQQMKMLWVRRGEGCVAQQHVQSISTIFEDLFIGDTF